MKRVAAGVAVATLLLAACGGGGSKKTAASNGSTTARVAGTASIAPGTEAASRIA